jgi:hypothetical protein
MFGGLSIPYNTPQPPCQMSIRREREHDGGEDAPRKKAAVETSTTSQLRKRRIEELRTGGAGAYPYDDGHYRADNGETNGVGDSSTAWLPPSVSVMDVDFEATGAATPTTPDLPPVRKRLTLDGDVEDGEPRADGEAEDEMSWEGTGRCARVENADDSKLLQEHLYAAPNFLLRTLTLDRLGRQRHRPAK